MPSNKDLITAIAALSVELEKDAPETEGKNNGDLANILSSLKADKDLTPDAAEAKERADEVKAEEGEKPPFYVMPGKCLTSKRGLIADGAEIKADDLAGGKEALDAFVKSGHVGKA